MIERQRFVDIVDYPSRACMNFLHVAWMHAGKLFKKPRKFRDPAGKNLVKLPCILENLVKLSCIFENLGSFTLRFQKKALQPNKSAEKWSIFRWKLLEKVTGTYEILSKSSLENDDFARNPLLIENKKIEKYTKFDKWISKQIIKNV